MHGLVLWAVYFMLKRSFTYAVLFMVLAVNFKQMALYFAIPFGVFTVALLFKGFKLNSNSELQIFSKLFWLVVVFVVSNLALWLPLIYHDPYSGTANIFARIFPIRRGIFEDKVASFWCVLHNFYKVNTIFSRET